MNYILPNMGLSRKNEFFLSNKTAISENACTILFNFWKIL